MLISLRFRSFREFRGKAFSRSSLSNSATPREDIFFPAIGDLRVLPLSHFRLRAFVLQFFQIKMWSSFGQTKHFNANHLVVLIVV